MTRAVYRLVTGESPGEKTKITEEKAKYKPLILSYEHVSVEAGVSNFDTRQSGGQDVVWILPAVLWSGILISNIYIGRNADCCNTDYGVNLTWIGRQFLTFGFKCLFQLPGVHYIDLRYGVSPIPVLRLFGTRRESGGNLIYCHTTDRADVWSTPPLEQQTRSRRHKTRLLLLEDRMVNSRPM